MTAGRGWGASRLQSREEEEEKEEDEEEEEVDG